jgi:beta-glucanase (GH16 family)
VTNRVIRALFIALILVFAATTLNPNDANAGRHKMRIVWEDDGSGAAGGPGALWQFGTWANPDELQEYNPKNASYEGGNLVIRAIKETSPSGKAYTSARLQSPLKWIYGKFEARIKFPSAVGAFPAFWLLGENDSTWPRCGEIDAAEIVSKANTSGPWINHGIHFANASGGDINNGTPNYASPAWFSDYHTYLVDVRDGQIQWYVDNVLAKKYSRSDAPAGSIWPFDTSPQGIVLNVAVGGMSGTPSGDWTSQSMLIDYVRVWQ